MVAQRHAIFREKALKHYTEGRKKDVLPHFSSISAAFFAWMLLGSLIVTGLVSWYGQVPVFLKGSGIVLANGSQASATKRAASTLAFFEPGQATRLHVGDATQVQFVSSPTPVTGTIAQVLPGTTSLAAAFAHFGLSFDATKLPTRQVAVALINMESGFPAADYAGSSAIVEANVGTQSLFSALTGVGIS